MVRQKDAGEHLAGEIEMANESPRMPAANRTRTLLIERPRVRRKPGVLDVELASRSECLAVAAVARRQNAIEHVDAARYRFNQVFGSAYAHQIARFISRHAWRNVFDDVEHHRFFFADAQAANGVTVEADLYGSLKTLAPQIEMRAALNDSEERLSCSANC
jgi:hypothetical protein